MPDLGIADSALHETILVVYAVMWAAVTGSVGRLRVFALQGFSARTARRFLWGLLLANAAPIVGLALLLQLPAVGGAWGVIAGGAIGLFPVLIPRLLHAFTASNEALPKSHTKREARQVLLAWDETWFKTIKEAWDKDWRCLNEVKRAGPNRRIAHLRAALLVGLSPSTAVILVLLLA